MNCRSPKQLLSTLLSLLFLVTASALADLHIEFDQKLRLPHVDQLCKLRYAAQELSRGNDPFEVVGYHHSATPEYAIPVSETNARTTVCLMQMAAELDQDVKIIGLGPNKLTTISPNTEKKSSGAMIRSIEEPAAKHCACHFEQPVYFDLEEVLAQHFSGELHTAMIMHGHGSDYDAHLLLANFLPLTQDTTVAIAAVRKYLQGCAVSWHATEN